jgi:hypothetical protein
LLANPLARSIRARASRLPVLATPAPGRPPGRTPGACAADGLGLFVPKPTREELYQLLTLADLPLVPVVSTCLTWWGWHSAVCVVSLCSAVLYGQVHVGADQDLGDLRGNQLWRSMCPSSPTPATHEHG